MKTLTISVILIIAGLFSASSFSQSVTQSQTSTQSQINKDLKAKKTDRKIRIKDSHGKWAFDEPPKRVAVINWTLTEQLLELGITPVAIADLKGFKQTSPQTQFPIYNDTKIIDLGSRFTPNLSQLKEAQPELILIGYSQRDLLRPLSNIAPVMYFNNFSRRNNNAKKADERFLILAKLFDKTTFAENKLIERDKHIQALKNLLAEQFNLNNQSPPKVTVASRKNKETWAYLDNSLPYSIVQKLGLPAEFKKEPSKLGTHKMKDSQLEQLEGCLLLINNSGTTFGSEQSNCTYSLRTTNTFGGAMSQLYLADAITSALINKLKQ